MTLPEQDGAPQISPSIPHIQDRSIRVILVDDQIVVRAGLRLLLESWPGIKVIGDAGKSAGVLQLISDEKPDVVLLDLDMSRNGDGLDFVRQVYSVSGEGRIVVLTGVRDSKTRLRFVRFGAMGIVLKERAIDELHKAIMKVHAGELWLDRALTADIIFELTRKREADEPDSETEKIESLTLREREVAILVSKGLQNEEIGKRLLISGTTVRHHLTSIFSKLGVSNRFELIILLYRNNVVAPPA